MCLPEDTLQEKRVVDDMNQADSSNITLVWNSCWPDGVLMGTFICFFITTKMSYILTLLLPLFPKGCQHYSHYNMTARGNSFFPPLTHYFFKWFCKERKNLDTKIAAKRTVQCDVSQRSFSKCLSVSAFIAYGEQHTRSPHPSWHRVCVRHGEDEMGFATRILHNSLQSGGQMGEVYMVLQHRATTLCRGAALGDVPSFVFPTLSFYLQFLTWEHEDFNTTCFGNTVISK